MNETLYELDSVLTELIEGLDGLIGSLKNEREAIIDYDLVRITDVTKEKQAALLRIQLLETTRQGIVKKLGQALGYTGQPSLDFLLQRVDDASTADRIRQRLSCVKSLAQAAAEFNELQRKYIDHSVGAIQSQLTLMDKLQGKIANPCYTQNGAMSSNPLQKKTQVMSRTV